MSSRRNLGPERPESLSRRRLVGRGLVMLCAVLAGCATFSPDPDWDEPHLQRAQTDEQGGVSVSVAVVDDEEARRIYGVNLGQLGIRAVWLKIENTTDEVFHLLPSSLDLDYFSQNEAAYRFHSVFRPSQNERMSEHFHSLAIRKDLRPREVNEGYVLVNRHRGGRYLIVELLGDRSLRRFDYLFTLPDGSFDYESVDLDSLYTQDERRDVGLGDLKRWAENLSCCTTNEDADRFGDPLNLIFVADENHLLAALARSGWVFTERVHPVTVWESIKSFFLGTPEWNFPISPLYAFGRHQDLAMQRPRGSIPQRNHMRVWLSPLIFEGTPVWVGQLSRDIGVKPTWHSPFLVTHVIDPEIDEDRAYLLELLMRAQSVQAFGYVDGVGESTAVAPRRNLGGDPYRTDGERLVLILSDEPVPANEVAPLRWETPKPTDRMAAD